MYNRIIGLIGPTGSGKSYMASQMFSAASCAAIYQIKRPHEELAFIKYATDVFQGDIRQFARALGQESYRYVYIPPEPVSQERNRLVMPDFDWFIRSCYHRERMLMIIDEAHFLCDPRYIPIFFRSAVVTGRSRYLDVLYIAQRFSQVHHDLTANSHEYVFWNLIEPGDLDSIEDRCGREVRDRVATLRPTVDNRRTGGELIPGEYFRFVKGVKITQQEKSTHGDEAA